MGDGQTLKLEIKVGADGLVEGMKLASKTVDDTVQKMNQRFKEVPKATKEASEGVEELTDKFREFAGEQRSEGRLAGFMAGEIQKLGISSKSAAGEITGFVSAFAFGGPIGIAIETVKLLVEKFNELGHEEEEAAEKSKKAADAIADGVKKFADELKAMDEAQGKTGTARTLASSLSPLERETEKKREEIARLKEEAAKAKEESDAAYKKVEANEPGTGFEELYASALEKSTRATKELADAQMGLFDVRRAVVAETSEAAPRIAKEAAAATAAAHRQASDREFAEAMAQDEKLLGMQIRDNERKLQEKRRLTEAFEQMDREQFESERAESDKAFAEAMRDDEKKLEEEVKDVHRQQEELKKVTSEAENFGNSVGSAFEKIAAGKESAGAAAKSVLSSEISAIEPVILAYIAKAAAAAAGSNADVPIIGPALAVAGAATVFGALKAMLGASHSAAGGMDIGSGINPIVQTHANEMILPANIANPLRANLKQGGGLAGGGSSGGPAVHVHVSTVDAAGFEGLMTKHQGTLMKVIGHAMKTGRAA